MSTKSLASRFPSPEAMLGSVFPRHFSRGASWPNPELSVGRLITRVGKDLIWEARGEAQEAFKNMAPDIKTHLDRCIEPLTSWVTWSMYMMGRSPRSSSPTIIFCCKVVEHRRKIRDVVKDSGILNQYTGIKTGHMPRLPDFDQLIPLTKGAETTGGVTKIGFEWVPLLYFGITPVLPLTVRQTSEGDTSFSKAALGGMICIGERRFYTTAAHAIVTSPPPDDGIAYCGDGDCQSDDDAFSFDGSEEWGSTTDVSSSDAWENRPEEMECGENRPLKGPQLQGLPSPTESDMCKPQRAADFQFDYQREVFVSQLEGGPGAALDYALIELAEDDARNVNMVYHGHIGAQEPLIISGVVKPPSQDVAVVLITCRGNLEGRMAANPVYSLAPGTKRSQEMLSATFKGQLEEGDCGSWVIDSHSGGLYGHLVAGSTTSGKALLVPFFEIFGDIRRRTGLMPHLPVAHFSEPVLKPSGATNSAEKDPWQLESPAEEKTDTVSAKVKEAQRDARKGAIPSDLGQLPCAGSLQRQTSKDWARSMAAQFEITMRDKQMNAARSLLSRSKQGGESSQVHPPSKASIQGLQDHASHPSQAAERQGQYGNLSDPSGNGKQEHVPGSGSAKGTANHPPGTTTRTTDTYHRGHQPQENAIAGPIEAPSRTSGLNPAKIPAPAIEPNSMRFRNLLISTSNVPLTWENPELLAKALGVVPLKRLYDEAEKESQRLTKQATSLSADQKPEWDYDDCTVQALLRWFKRRFFMWVKSPACPVCSSSTIRLGNASPTDEERGHGAHCVELYQCSHSGCQALERFPRYSDPIKLLQTRRGRVGEWTTCFGLMCRAIGARVRWVWTAEDHVWIEVYSKHQRRWVHVDAVEEAWDEPHLYTDKLGKKLSYVIAFSVDGATDVTRRYARNMDKTKPRIRCPEYILLRIVREIRTLRRAKLSPRDRARLEEEDSGEDRELRSYIVRRTIQEMPDSGYYESLPLSSFSLLDTDDVQDARPPQSAEYDDAQAARPPRTNDGAISAGFLPGTIPWET